MQVLPIKVLLKTGLGVVSLLLAFGAVGQVQRSGDNSARVMQQLQQLSAEKAQAQAENTKLKTEVEDLKAQLAKTSTALNASEQRAKKVTAAASMKDSAAAQETNEVLTRTRSQMQELVVKFRETAQALKDVETDRDQLRAQGSTRDRDLKQCVDKNAGMYLVSDEILRNLENRGVWSSLTDKEPFTRLSRTRLENLIDDYRYRVDEMRVGQKKSTAAAN
jgi:chromosome segregation ATPase